MCGKDFDMRQAKMFSIIRVYDQNMTSVVSSGNHEVARTETLGG